MAAQRGTITVRVPAHVGNIGIIRSVASAVAATSGLQLSSIEDVRLAVDEACGQLLRLAPGATTLTLTTEQRSNGVELVVSIDAEIDERARADGAEFLTWHLLGALTDGATLERSDEGPAIRFARWATAS